MWGVGEFRKTRHPRNIKFDEILEICFSGTENSWISGAWNLRSFRFADMRSSGIVVRRRHGVANTRKPVISSWRWREPRRAIDSGIFRGSSSEVKHGDIHEPVKKQSQSCRPKKSGFWVWTGGRLVNMLSEKDILICVHTRNILWARGRFRNAKVPSSPYKRGRRARVNGFSFLGTCAIY
jgi:hypothetical protein